MQKIRLHINKIKCRIIIKSTCKTQLERERQENEFSKYTQNPALKGLKNPECPGSWIFQRKMPSKFEENRQNNSTASTVLTYA